MTEDTDNLFIALSLLILLNAYFYYINLPLGQIKTKHTYAHTHTSTHTHFFFFYLQRIYHTLFNEKKKFSTVIVSLSLSHIRHTFNTFAKKKKLSALNFVGEKKERNRK